MQDFTGVPAVVDLAAMRDAMKQLGGDPSKINPRSPVDLVIDHSVIVNFAGTPLAFKKNVAEEYAQNQERYTFLKWAQKAFNNFRVVPPGTGICHQVNSTIPQTVWLSADKEKVKADGNAVRCRRPRILGHAGRYLPHHRLAEMALSAPRMWRWWGISEAQAAVTSASLTRWCCRRLSVSA